MPPHHKMLVALFTLFCLSLIFLMAQTSQLAGADSSTSTPVPSATRTPVPTSVSPTQTLHPVQLTATTIIRNATETAAAYWSPTPTSRFGSSSTPTLTNTPAPPANTDYEFQRVHFEAQDWRQGGISGNYEGKITGYWYNNQHQSITIVCWYTFAPYSYAPPYERPLEVLEEFEGYIKEQTVRVRLVNSHDPMEILPDYQFFLIGPIQSGDNICLIETWAMSREEVETLLTTVQAN